MDMDHAEWDLPYLCGCIANDDYPLEVPSLKDMLFQRHQCRFDAVIVKVTKLNGFGDVVITILCRET